LALSLIGLCEALDSLNGTRGGPGNGGVTADRTSQSATVFSVKMESVLVAASLIRTCNRESDLSAVVFLRSMTG